MLNEWKKLSWLDTWWRVYTKKAGRRQHRDDKKRAREKQRSYNKKLIQKEMDEYYDEG
jgi:hypothetical protein